MTNTSHRIIEAFEKVDRHLRLDEIMKGMMPYVDIDADSPDLPQKWLHFDKNGSLTVFWKLLSPDSRQLVNSKFEEELPPKSAEGLASLIKEHVKTDHPLAPSEASSNISRPMAMGPPPVQPTPLPAAVNLQLIESRSSSPASTPSKSEGNKKSFNFPASWVDSDPKGKMRKMWERLNVSQRLELRRLTRETVSRTGLEATPQLMACFKRISSAKTIGEASDDGVSASLSTPESRTTVDESSKRKSIEKDDKRTILGVENIRLDKSTGGAPPRVLLQVKYNSDGKQEWIDAAKVLIPETLNSLRSVLGQIKY